MKNKLIISVALSWILYIVGFFSSYPYLLEFERENSSKIDTIRNTIEYSLMFFSFLTFCILFLRKNIALKSIGGILILLLSLNFMLSASCFFIYKQGFNVGMMLSILETNITESLSMMKTLVLPIIFSCIFFVLLILSIYKWGGVYCYKQPITNNIMKLFSCIWLILPLGFYLKHQYINNKGGGFMVKNIFYHAKDIFGANNLKKEIAKIKDTKINYQLISTHQEPIQNIVILVGESVRKQNMSLYGYQIRETTPIANSEKHNMLLFQNAYAPAAITNLAVPIILSNVDINNYGREITKLSDNIINVANRLGYETHWYSTQGGAQGITAIASFAKNKKWINGFDNALIPYLKTALNSSQSKKLIILHINGSHPYACDKYPISEAKWNGGIDECYDNSIRYTDKIIGEIFTELKEKNSVLLYTSDHGQIKNSGKYIHGDYREAIQVPYFIWYSEKINTNNRGKTIEKETSTATNYETILKLMGVKNLKTIDNSGKYLKLDLTSIKYEDLK